MAPLVLALIPLWELCVPDQFFCYLWSAHLSSLLLQYRPLHPPCLPFEVLLIGQGLSQIPLPFPEGFTDAQAELIFPAFHGAFLCLCHDTYPLLDIFACI